MIAASAEATVYFEPKVNFNVYPVLPGHHKVISDPGIALTTLLGSCVAACIRDRRTGIGGMNHFLLPHDKNENSTDFSARYGVNAMEVLINEILRSGARKEDLEAKVFGAGNIIVTADMAKVGAQNAAFVVSYLKTEGIGLLASDLGGIRARRVFYFPATGNVRVLNLSPSETSQAGRQDAQLDHTLRKKTQTSQVELF